VSAPRHVDQRDRAHHHRAIHVVEQDAIDIEPGDGLDLRERRGLDLDQEGGWITRAASARVTAAVMSRAAATWLSLIRIMSNRPKRWLTPPPARTAARWNARSRGRSFACRECGRPCRDLVDERARQRRHAGEAAARN